MSVSGIALLALGLRVAAGPNGVPDMAMTRTATGTGLGEKLGPLPISVEADRLRGDPKAGAYVAEGNVVVRRDNVVIQADRVRFDEPSRMAVADGHVFVIEPTSVLTCTHVQMHMPELAGGLEQIELHLKAPIPESVRETLSGAAIRRYGKDQLIVSGEHLDRLGRRTMKIEGGTFTACDCGEGATPTWRIDAAHADIDLDEGAWLFLPVFRAGVVPFMVLPVFYVPLGQRRSGLLVPRIRGIGNTITGLHLSEPLFLTLGRSADLTFEPGYMTARGWTGELEARWVPSRDSHGQADVSVILDRGVQGKTGAYAIHGPVHAVRYAFAGREDARFDALRLVADVTVVGDPAYLAEFAETYLARQVESTMSRVTLSRSFEGSDYRAAGGLLLMQDLRGNRYDAAELRKVRLLSADANGPGEIEYRLAELRLDAAPRPVLRDVPLLGEARLVADTFVAPRPDAPRFVRADLRPALSAPLNLGGVAVLEAALAARLTAWSGEVGHASAGESRLAAIGDLSLHTEVGRRYQSWYHRIRPELAYVVIPFVATAGRDGFRTLDEIDQLAVVSQARARLLTDWWEIATGRRIGGIETWFGRDLGLGASHPGIGDSNVVLHADVSPEISGVQVNLDGRTAYDPTIHEVTELLLIGAVSLPNGDGFSMSYGNFSAALPTSTFLAPEELVPSHTIPRSGYLPLAQYAALPASAQVDAVPWSAYHGVTLGVFSHPVPPLTVAFSANISPDPHFSPVRATSSVLRWDSPCDCFGVGLVVGTDRYRPAGQYGLPAGFSANFLISLGRLGEVRTQ